MSKKLTIIEKLQNGKIRIDFADGFTDEVDLLVGADGIRSVGSTTQQSTILHRSADCNTVCALVCISRP